MTNSGTEPRLDASKALMRGLMRRYRSKGWFAAVAAMAVGACAAQNAPCCRVQPELDVKQVLQVAVNSELAAARNDHSAWMYTDKDKTPEKDGVYEVVETPQGTVKRMTWIDGRPVDAQEQRKETDRIRTFIHDTEAQARARRAGAHDDAQATQMLKMLPNAFVWTKRSEDAEYITLDFKPNPDFDPPNMEARVMGLMAGEMVIARKDNRIKTLRGTLTDDVKIGFGMLGRLRRGGTFDVERREVAPHSWQITETHVHIEGKALLFKTIGQQEDESKSGWKPSRAETLAEAARLLGVE